MKSTVNRRRWFAISGRSHRTIRSRHSQSGLTLVELIIALAIIGLIAGVTVMAIHQLLTASRQANDQQYAVSQLRQAEHWMTRDALMAHTVVPDSLVPTGFPVVLSWTTSASVSYEIEYLLEDMPIGSLKILQRKAVIDGGAPSILRIAQGIEYDELDEPPPTWCSYSRPVFTVALTARSGAHTETRIFDAKLRSDIAT